MCLHLCVCVCVFVCKGVSVCIYECVSVHRQELCSDFSPCNTLFTSTEKVTRENPAGILQHFTSVLTSRTFVPTCFKIAILLMKLRHLFGLFFFFFTQVFCI